MPKSFKYCDISCKPKMESLIDSCVKPVSKSHSKPLQLWRRFLRFITTILKRSNTWFLIHNYNSQLNWKVQITLRPFMKPNSLFFFFLGRFWNNQNHHEFSDSVFFPQNTQTDGSLTLNFFIKTKSDSYLLKIKYQKWETITNDSQGNS